MPAKNAQKYMNATILIGASPFQERTRCAIQNTSGPDFAAGSFLIQFRTGGDVGGENQKAELFFLAFLMNGRDPHPARFDAHHGTGRQVYNGMLSCK